MRYCKDRCWVVCRKMKTQCLDRMISLWWALLICLVLARMVLAWLLSPINRVGLMFFLLILVEATEDRIISLLMLAGKHGQIMFRKSPILI